MANDPADESLRSRLLRGDEDAWAVVYEEIVPRVRATIRGRCGPGKPWMGAEDAVHSACRTTFRRLKEGLLADGLERLGRRAPPAGRGGAQQDRRHPPQGRDGGEVAGDGPGGGRGAATGGGEFAGR